MARLEIQIGMLPPLLQRVAALAGPTLAVQLAREFGGKRVYLPQRMFAHHPLAQCIGLAPAVRLAAEYAGEDLVIPSARVYTNWLDARALLVCGLSQPAIASRLRMGQRSVQRILRGFDPAAVEMNDTVRAIARHYRVRSTTVRRASGLPDKRDPQADFGFPNDARGLRLTDFVAPPGDDGQPEIA